MLRRATVHQEKLPEVPSFFCRYQVCLNEDEGYHQMVMGQQRAEDLIVSEFSGQGTVRMNSADRGATGFGLSAALGKFLTAPPLEFPCR